MTESMLFSGDWEWQPDLECYVMAFEAIRFGEPWNGFATPVVSERVARAMVLRWQLLTLEGEADSPEWVDTWEWDGATLVVTDVDGETRIPQGGEDWGRAEYDLGPLGYTFARIDRFTDDGEEARVIGRISSELKGE